MSQLSPLRFVRTACALVLLGLVACRAGQQEPRCPGGVPKTRCLTEEVCDYDPTRECFVCHCAPPAYQPPQRLDPRPSSVEALRFE